MPTVCRSNCHHGKCQCHASEQRQTSAAERLIRAGKHKWQYRQDTRTQNCQDPTDKSQNVDQHRVARYVLSDTRFLAAKCDSGVIKKLQPWLRKLPASSEKDGPHQELDAPQRCNRPISFPHSSYFIVAPSGVPV